MNRYTYYCNAAGQSFPLPTRPLEPPDDWEEEPEQEGDWDLTGGIPYIDKEEAIGRLEQLLNQAKELPDDVLVIGPLAMMHDIEVFDDWGVRP